MVVMGNYFPSYENVAGIGYHKLICADVKYWKFKEEVAFNWIIQEQEYDETNCCLH